MWRQAEAAAGVGGARGSEGGQGLRPRKRWGWEGGARLLALHGELRHLDLDFKLPRARATVRAEVTARVGNTSGARGDLSVAEGLGVGELEDERDRRLLEETHPSVPLELPALVPATQPHAPSRRRTRASRAGPCQSVPARPSHEASPAWGCCVGQDGGARGERDG